MKVVGNFYLPKRWNTSSFLLIFFYISTFIILSTTTSSLYFSLFDFFHPFKNYPHSELALLISTRLIVHNTIKSTEHYILFPPFSLNLKYTNLRPKQNIQWIKSFKIWFLIDLHTGKRSSLYNFFKKERALLFFTTSSISYQIYYCTTLHLKLKNFRMSTCRATTR